MAKGSQNTRKGKPNLPSKGRDLSEAEKIALAEKVCRLYAEDKLTLDQCLEKNNIKARSTWRSWCKKIPQIEQLYQEAQFEKAEIYKRTNVERARTALERALEGFTKAVEEREEEYLYDKAGDPILDDDGNHRTKIVKVKRKVIYVPPKLGAITYILNNVDKTNFERNPQGETNKQNAGKYDDWTDEQLEKELRRLDEEE